MAGMIEPRRLIVTNQFQRYHVSWHAIRNLDHSPSLFQADFAILGKRFCRPPTVFRRSRQAKAAMLEAFGYLAVIGKTSHLPCCPKSRTVGRVRVARPEISIELQPPRAMLIAGGKVSFACPNMSSDSPARAVMCRSIAAIAGLVSAASSGPNGSSRERAWSRFSLDREVSLRMYR
jgi:hypothetical protein